MVEEPQSRNVDRGGAGAWDVVLYTNEIFGDFRLRHREIQFLFGRSQQPEIHLCLPEVVIREMANQFRERWSEARERYETALADLEQLIGRTLSDRVRDDEIRVAADRYEIDLREELARNGVHVEPIPDRFSGFELLLSRDLGRRRPFGDRKITDDKRNRRDRGGMRDALIWESVLALCDRERRSLAFITDNIQDFGNTQGDQLHEDLLGDLAGVGVARQNVKLFRSIRAFNDAFFRSDVSALTRDSDTTSASSPGTEPP